MEPYGIPELILNSSDELSSITTRLLHEIIQKYQDKKGDKLKPFGILELILYSSNVVTSISIRMIRI